MKPTCTRARRAQALAVTFILFMCQGALAADVVKLSPEQSRALGVETAPLAAQAVGELQGVAAEVVLPPSQLRVVAAPLAGLIEQVAVASGAEVSKGQLLATLASPQLAEIQRGLLQAATQLQLARDNLKRDEQLAQDGIIADSRLRSSRSQHAEAAAAHAERRQALKLAGLSDTAIGRLQTGQGLGAAVEIRAPMDGVAIDVTATAGQRVEASAPLFKLARLDPLWLELQVPVQRLDRVATGAAVRVPAVDARGRVVSIGRRASANQTVLVRAEIAQGASRLRPGQFVEASLATAVAPGHWRVPNAALVRTGGRLLVFVHTPSGFAARTVEMVGEDAADSLVKGGFTGDERIAVRGVAALKAALSGIGGE